MEFFIGTQEYYAYNEYYSEIKMNNLLILVMTWKGISKGHADKGSQRQSPSPGSNEAVFSSLPCQNSGRGSQLKQKA